jgi:glycosyltransferase involved in cell wall biosynthesis
MSARSSIFKAATREYLAHDLGVLKEPIARSVFNAARLIRSSASIPRRARAFAWLMRLHSGAFSTGVDRRIADAIRDAMTAERHGQATGLFALYDEVIQKSVDTFLAGANPDPRRLIGSRILVVKAARPDERGVLVVDYSYVFPLMAGLFDLPAIAARYTIVLEPSWAGSCTPEILLYSRLDHPVFIETIEPRDREFLASLGANLQTVPVAANWWVDPRMPPPAGGPRDIDVAMVAAWAGIKRHWRFFRTLGQLRRQGHKLKVALIGYRYDLTRADVEALAQHFGVRDQIETFERITQEEVSALLARSKVHVLWSRRECANRAIIEAMLADTPVIAREGLTFGYRYPYINEHTGRFVPERDLGRSIVDMIANRERYSPRDWILQHMTAEKATAILEARLRDAAAAAGEPWTEGLAVKTSTLDTQRYWNPDDRAKFDADYRFLESQLRALPRRVVSRP